MAFNRPKPGVMKPAAKKPEEVVVPNVPGTEEVEADELVKVEESSVEQEVTVDTTPAEEEQVVETKEEAVVEEQPKETVKKKSTKKSSSKKKTTMQEVVANIKEEKAVEKLPNMSLEECVSTMMNKANPTTADWEEVKNEITERINGLVIDPDATPGEIKMLIAEIDQMLTELKIRKVNTEERNNGILEHIDYVRLANSKGSNSEERKTAGYEAMMSYKVDPDAVNSANLLELKVFITNQSNFYNEMINVLVDKKNLLITFSGLTKIEAQLGGY